MYEAFIREYLKRLSLKDINDFASKNGIVLPNGEDKKPNKGYKIVDTQIFFSAMK